MFGQSFVISRVKVKVDDDEDSKAAQKAQYVLAKFYLK